MSPLQYQEQIINFLLSLKSNGYRESTLEKYSRDLKHLSKHVDLEIPESVKLFIAQKNSRDSWKEKLAFEYATYAKWRGLEWRRPNYQRDTSLPFIPLEKEKETEKKY